MLYIEYFGKNIISYSEKNSEFNPISKKFTYKLKIWKNSIFNPYLFAITIVTQLRQSSYGQIAFLLLNQGM